MGVQLSLPHVALPPAPLYLVACVAAKQSCRARARELYTSQWFEKARRYVEARGADWVVLSALHGLVEPGDELDPYDVTLARLDASARRNWGARVLAQLAARAPAPRPLVLLAGERYRAPIVAAHPDRCLVPMQGLGIGEQLAWLKRHARP